MKDKDGKPLDHQWVVVRNPGGRFGNPLDRMWSDAQGRFHFDFVPTGQPLEVNTGTWPYLDQTQSVTVTSGGDVAADFVLERRPIGGSVQGLVIDQDGKPVAGASVGNGWPRSRQWHETFTNAAGRFVMDDVFNGGGQGGAVVVVRAKGFAPRAAEFTPGPADNPTEVTVKLDEPGPSHPWPGRRQGGQAGRQRPNPLRGRQSRRLRRPRRGRHDRRRWAF